MLNLNAVMVGLQYLFLEPNADDPLNKGTLTCHLFGVDRAPTSRTDAAEDLRRDRAGFSRNVKNSMRGHPVNGESFDNVQITK